MNLKEAACLLGWKREQVEAAILDGVETPHKKLCTKLVASKQGSDFDIREEDIDEFLKRFEAEEPGRYPPVPVRRELLIESGYQCAVCRSDAPLRFHHIIDWANLKHHDSKHMIAICGSCHDKIGVGQIDTRSQRAIKARLSRPSSADNQLIAPNTNSSQGGEDQDVIDVTDAERVVWSLPRGFLMLEDITFEENDSWAVVAHYYHFGEGWRTGTHFHKSYREYWRVSKDLNNQCEKVSMPPGDRDFAYSGFYLMQELRNTDTKLDIRKKVDPYAKRGHPVAYYEPSKPIRLREVAGKYPEWNGTEGLRDLIAEMEDVLEVDFSHSVPYKLAERGFSIAHRVAVEAAKFFGGNHPSTRFIQKVIDEYDRKWSVMQIRDWMDRLRNVAIDALRSR